MLHALYVAPLILLANSAQAQNLACRQVHISLAAPIYSTKPLAVSMAWYSEYVESYRFLAGISDSTPVSWASFVQSRSIVKLYRSVKAQDWRWLLEYPDELIRDGQFKEWLDLVYLFHRANVGRMTFRPTNVDLYLKKIGVIDGAFPEDLFLHALEWSSEKSLREHFKKRRRENEIEIYSVQDYLNLANRFLQSRGSADLVFRRLSGAIVKYDKTTGEIAIVSPQGRILTYYTLSSGYRKPSEFDDYVAHVLLEIKYSGRPSN